MSCHQTAAQNHNVKVANNTFENMAEVRYLRTVGKNQNIFHEEIKNR